MVMLFSAVLLSIYMLMLFMWPKFQNSQFMEKRFGPMLVCEEGTLYMTQEDNRRARTISIEDNENVNVSYKPEKYTFTAVTIGGVTTGGINKSGGYEYVSRTSKSGKYKLVYQGLFKKELVFSIALNDKLYKKAQNSDKVKSYLNGKEIIVVNSTISSNSIISAVNSGSDNFLSNIAKLHNLSMDGYPSWEKCKNIIDWIYEATEEDGRQS